jgi:hypothetical protein
VQVKVLIVLLLFLRIFIFSHKGHNWPWDDLSNIRPRIQDGVIAITQANARGDWSGHLNYLRGNLPKVC